MSETPVNNGPYTIDGQPAGVLATTDAGLERIAQRAAAEAAEELAASKPLDFVPFGDRILTKRHAAPEEVKIGSIYVAPTAIERPLEADVIAVPDGMVNFQPGDRVLISKYAGVEIKIDGREYLVLREAEILGRRNRG